MDRKTFARIGMIGALGLTLTACEGRRETPPTADTHGDMPMGQHDGMEGMPSVAGMQMDREMMRNHAQEADAMASQTRDHVQQMRRLSAEQQHQRMGEHVAHVSQMLGLMNRHMREMGMGMGMDDEQMGGMMGMSGDEHRRMVDQMQGIRADLEQLQTASLSEVRQRMPGHLDRLEGMVETMEQSAAAMRRM